MTSDQEYIEANRQRLAQLEAALNAAEESLDLDARAREAGFDLSEAKALAERLAAAASPQAREEAQRAMAEMDAADKNARAAALTDMSRGATGTAPSRRPRNMA
ncbi:MAG: hypothetical protein RIR43_2304 [Pseudomonadota bacterium]|jgi:hypothetical protein